MFVSNFSTALRISAYPKGSHTLPLESLRLPDTVGEALPARSSATFTAAASGPALPRGWAKSTICWASALGVSPPYLHPSHTCPAAGGKQQSGWAAEDAGGREAAPAMPGMRWAARRNTACTSPLGWGWGQGEEEKGRVKVKSGRGWKDLSHRLMNFNPRSNSRFLGPGTVSPFQYLRSLCRLRKDLAGKYLTRYFIKYLRFSLTAWASLINTQLKWKLFLFPPFLFVNRKGDSFWTLCLFTMKQKYISGIKEHRSQKASSVSKGRTEMGNRWDDLRMPLARV